MLAPAAVAQATELMIADFSLLRLRTNAVDSAGWQEIYDYFRKTRGQDKVGSHLVAAELSQEAI